MKKKGAFYILIPFVLLVVLLVGPRPKTPLYQLNWPKVGKSGLELSDSIVQREWSNPFVKPGNQSEIVWADPINPEPTEWVILYLHGFSASHEEGAPVHCFLADTLHANLFLPRLVTHGVDSFPDMEGYTADGLWRSAVRALAVAEKLGDKVIIMSTSTGGTLAIRLAAEFPDKVNALINLSPNVHPLDPSSWVLNKPWGKQLTYLVMGGETRKLEGKEDDYYHRYWNVEYHINSLVEMYQLVATSMTPEVFHRVKQPSLTIMYYKNENERDPVVDTKEIEFMHENLGTPLDQKRLVPLENAGTHVIGNGIYSEAIPEVEMEMLSFVDEVLNTP